MEDRTISDLLDKDAFELAAARAADELKAENVLVLRLAESCAFADYFVIASCHTRTHMHAIARRIDEAARLAKRHRLGYEGEMSETWQLLDYGDVIVHLFHPQTRQHYNLERLWADAVAVEFAPAASAADIR